MILLDVFGKVIKVEKNFNLRKNFLDRAIAVLTLKKDLHDGLELERIVDYKEIVSTNYEAINKRIGENGLFESFCVTINYNNGKCDFLTIKANHVSGTCVYTVNDKNIILEIEAVKKFFLDFINTYKDKKETDYEA